MVVRRGLSFKTMVSASVLKICPTSSSDSTGEIRPEPVPLAVFGLGLPFQKTLAGGMGGGPCCPKRPPPSSTREHEKTTLNIVLQLQNLDWQEKIVCRVAQRFFPTSTTTPRFCTPRGMARRPGSSSAQTGCTNTSVKEIFTRKFLCRTSRTIGVRRRPWLWPRHEPKLRLAV